MAEKNLYRVVFLNQGQVYEVYAAGVGPSDLPGFVEIEGYQFGERSQMVVDPSEERLKSEFEGVERSFIPMHAVIRIDEVEQRGVAQVTEYKGEKITPFPSPSAPRRSDR